MAVQTCNGGCHCGRVRFQITTDLSRATECNCSIWSKKGKSSALTVRAPVALSSRTSPSSASTAAG